MATPMYSDNQILPQPLSPRYLIPHRRQGRPPQYYSPSQVVGLSRTRVKDYTLNVPKQLARKAADSARPPIVEIQKEGCNVLYEMNSGAFEIFKAAIRPCLEKLAYRVEEI
jgi:hypothetical protein